jgi:hypothetical protein
VTNERLLVAEAKRLGGAAFQSTPWVDLEAIWRFPNGAVGYKKRLKPGSRWPLWEVEIWEGKSYKTPVDTKALDVLEMASRDAFEAVS